jgi:hypothetical protein
MQIEALETALTETKFRSQQDINKLQMVIEDYESKNLNNSLSFEEIEEIIR